MNETVEQFMTSRDAQEKCSRWVENVKNSTIVNENGKHKLESDSEETIDTDSDFTSVSKSDAKKRKVAVKLKSEKLNLVCEWKECEFSSNSIDSFIKHVATHVTQLDIRITPEMEVYACLWSGCIYENEIDVNIIRHVNYHAFHSKLKCIGLNVRGRTKLPVSITLTLIILYYYNNDNNDLYLIEMSSRYRLEKYLGFIATT